MSEPIKTKTYTDIVTNTNMPYRNLTSKDYINKIKIGEI